MKDKAQSDIKGENNIYRPIEGLGTYSPPPPDTLSRPALHPSHPTLKLTVRNSHIRP